MQWTLNVVTAACGRRMVNRRVRQIWPSVGGMNVLGLGYATPFLARLAATGLRALGWTVREHLLPGTWPEPGEPQLATLGRAMTIADHRGRLVGRAQFEIVVDGERRRRLARVEPRRHDHGG